MTKNFADFTGTTASQNTHIDHLEDLLLDGPDAARWVVQILMSLGHALAAGESPANIELSTKWDGSPAIVFGPDPADGRFFVGTKSVFAQNAKPAKSHEDIDRFYATPVALVLHRAFDYLKTINPGVVLQGDVLYWYPPLATDAYYFRPNTLSYRVPPDHPLWSRIHGTQFGLVVHTIYTSTGSTLRALQAFPLTPEDFASFRHDPNVLVLDAHFSPTKMFTPEDTLDFMLALEKASTPSVSDDLYFLVQQEPLRTLLQRYLNFAIRMSAPPGLVGFRDFLQWKERQEVDKRKSMSGQEAVKARFTDVYRLLNERDLTPWFTLYARLRAAKDLLIRTMHRESDLDISVPTETGPVPTGPEGYVIRAEGRVAKLVDRKVFSFHNFKNND